MSIERLDATYFPMCDYCGAELSPEHNVYDAISAKKAAGWKTVKNGDVWWDYCPACYREQFGAAADFKGV